MHDVPVDRPCDSCRNDFIRDQAFLAGFVCGLGTRCSSPFEALVRWRGVGRPSVEILRDASTKAPE